MNINYHLLFHFCTALFFTSATKNESNKAPCIVLQGWTILVFKNKQRNSTTLLLGVPIAWFGYAYWLWSLYLPCWACCISTCQLLLKSLSLTRSPAPSPPEIHRMIWASAWRYVALAFCWLAWLAWKPRCSLIGWRNDVYKTCNFTEGRCFLRITVPIQWNGFFKSVH